MWCASTRGGRGAASLLYYKNRASNNNGLFVYASAASRQQRWYGRPGKYSSMLDMGAAPRDHKSSMEVRVGKNNKIQAIAFDFDLITRSIERSKAEEEQKKAEDFSAFQKSSSAKKAESSPFTTTQAVTPNVGLVQTLAKLLNVQLGGTSGSNKRDAENMEDEEDLVRALSRGTGRERESESKKNDPPSKAETKKAPMLPFMDIRSKYNAKLHQRVEGGLAGVERQKEEAEHTLQKGDASTHLAARANAIMSGSGGSAAAKWLAATGTGNVLRYASSRSIRLALLPIPNSANPQISRGMSDLVQQLPRVNFDLLLKVAEDLTAKNLISQVRQHMEEQGGITAICTLVVSDRDDYLRAAKEAGMYTCRVRPKNARRGNVSTSHTVESISEVEDVVNEISGISYNAVFGLGQITKLL
jgi:hypothetical protein